MDWITDIYDYLGGMFESCYVVQFDQSVLLDSPQSNISIIPLNQIPTNNKDMKIYDQSTVKIEVIGGNFGNQTSDANTIRKCLVKFTSSHIARMIFESMEYTPELENQIHRYTLTFNVNIKDC